MTFREYMHVEKWGNVEVENIELGKVFVFPKIDGTNASVWRNEEPPTIQGGSRTRVLSLENDNQGFYSYLYTKNEYFHFLEKYKNLRLYGEWLVPHTLKTYREDAWRKFWIFDVYNDDTHQYLSYEAYQPLLEEFGLDYLAPLAIITNGNSEQFYRCMEKNVFLIEDGKGVGEGVVLKNYSFYNKFGNQVWAKLITSEFKEKHHKKMGAPEIGCEPIELQIAEKYITRHLVDKVVAKISNETEGWTSKYIPRLLETVFYDLVNEEMYNIIKEYKNPQINFKALKAFVIDRIKKQREDLF